MTAQKPSQSSPAEADPAGKPSTSPPIPLAGVERLFEKLSSFYGSKFGDMWRGCDLEAVKKTWAEALAGATVGEVKRGLSACLSRTFPPTLPEFLMLCRPPVDYETAFLEACEQLRRRESGSDEWSHPAIYWAAAKIGSFDMRNSSWGAIKARWTVALKAEMDKREWPEVPPRLEALPAPGEASITQEEAQRRITEMQNMLSRAMNGKR